MSKNIIQTLLFVLILYASANAERYVVTTRGVDSLSSFLTLQAALENANNNAGLDTISFDIQNPGVNRILLKSSLVISDPVIIDGTTQPGYSGTPLIELYASPPLNDFDGIVLSSGFSEINGIAVYGFAKSGINITSSQNKITACLIGKGASADSSYLGNGVGIKITGSNNYIGSLISGSGNLISGNSGYGIQADSCSALSIVNNNIIKNNSDGIFLNAENSFLFSNKISFNGGNGVQIQSSGNTIGRVTGPYENIISNNTLNGVFVARGFNNGIIANSIFTNGELGIKIGNGIFPNDSLDVDNGPNRLQNFPELISLSPDRKKVQGKLLGRPLTEYVIDLYANNFKDESGYGEGEVYLGTFDVMSDGSGIVIFDNPFKGSILPGQFISATATDPGNNTSPFSICLPVENSNKKFGDHFVINTTYSGVPLHWPGGNSSYNLSSSLPPEFQSLIEASFNEWNTVAGINSLSSGVINSSAWAGNYDAINNNVWITSGWNELTGTDENTIALTRIRYNALNGEITDADIAFNAENFQWSSDHQPGTMDIMNCAVHEAGHFWGLGDIYNPGDVSYYLDDMGSENESETMYGIIAPNEILKTDLNAGDINGIENLYSSSASSNISLILIFDGSPGFAGIESAYDQSKKSAIELINRMSSGDKIGVLNTNGETKLALTQLNNINDRNTAASIINNLLPGETGSIAAAIQTALNQLEANGTSNNKSAVIVYSTGVESVQPFIVDILNSISSKEIKIFTMSLKGNSIDEQNNLSKLSSLTDGEFTIMNNVMQIGNVVSLYYSKLTGLQVLFEKTESSDSLIGVPFPGLRWQGAIVDSGTTEILPGLRWQGSEFDLNLEDPNGKIITADSALNNQEIEFYSGTNYKYYKIKNPVPGRWDMFALAVDVPETEDYTIYMLAYSDITLEYTLQKEEYYSGDTITTEVKLFNGGGYRFDQHVSAGVPITDASVIAHVLLPDSSSRVIQFDYTGNGTYLSDFFNTRLEGSYAFSINAFKENSFNRTFSKTIFVSASDPVLVEDEINAAQFILFQNYPNPFNPSTEIKFSIYENGFTTLKIFNILGEEVRTLFSGELNAGNYKYIWDGQTNSGEQASAAVYFYSLTSGDYKSFKKMILLK